MPHLYYHLKIQNCLISLGNYHFVNQVPYRQYNRSIQVNLLQIRQIVIQVKFHIYLTPLLAMSHQLLLEGSQQAYLHALLLKSSLFKVYSF